MAGVYPFEVAETKVEKVHELARAADYSWRLAQWDACVAAARCEDEKP